MASSHSPGEGKDLPLPLKARAENDLDYFTHAWNSGSRGGGSVPKDFGWPTNPKQHQDEVGTGTEAEAPAPKR